MTCEYFSTLSPSIIQYESTKVFFFFFCYVFLQGFYNYKIIVLGNHTKQMTASHNIKPKNWILAWYTYSQGKYCMIASITNKNFVGHAKQMKDLYIYI
jgi:hypothetical protein